MLGQYLKLGKYHFLPHPLQLINEETRRLCNESARGYCNPACHKTREIYLKKSDLDCGTTETNGNHGSENIAGSAIVMDLDSHVLVQCFTLTLSFLLHLFIIYLLTSSLTQTIWLRTAKKNVQECRRIFLKRLRRTIKILSQEIRSPGQKEYTVNNSIATFSSIRNRVCRLRLLQILAAKRSAKFLNLWYDKSSVQLCCPTYTEY